MNKRLVRRMKRFGILSSPVIVGALMVLSLFSGTVSAGTTAVLSDITPADGLMSDQSPFPDGNRLEIPALGLNLETDIGDTLISVDVSVTDITNFNPGIDLANVYLYRDEPNSINGVWDSGDTQIGSGAGFGGGPPTWTTTITPAVQQIPVDDFWENAGDDYFITVVGIFFMDDGDQFTVGIPSSGIVTSSGALATSYTTQTITVDDSYPDVGPATLTVSSTMTAYFDNEDLDNAGNGYLGNSDSIFFNDLPGEGSDQVVTITISGYNDAAATTGPYGYAFFGDTPYYNENPMDVNPGPPYIYSGPFSISYKLTWTEADTAGGIGGLNQPNPMRLWLEDRVGMANDYMNGNFYFIQDDDTPMSVIDFAVNPTDEVWYYDESLSGNWLPYVDENNFINVYTTDQWWIGDPEGGSGFDKPGSYARFRVGVVRGGAELIWGPGWMDCEDENPVPTGVDINVQTQIVNDATIGGGAAGPNGYYFIEFASMDDVSNTVRVGDGNYEINVPGHPAGVVDLTNNYFDTNRIYFKIARDFSWYHGAGDLTNGYTAPGGTTTYREAAFSVSDFDIGPSSDLVLYDTEIFLDSSLDGERHVDVWDTLITGNLTNTLGYDGRTAFTHRGLASYSGGTTDYPYTFWIRDGAVLDMFGTVVEGCGFGPTTDETQDDRGLYIRTPYIGAQPNAHIDNSEIRFGYAGIVIQDEGGAKIENSEIWNNGDRGIYAVNAQSKIEIMGCDIHDNTAEGIFLDGCSAEIDNNDITDNTLEGIYIDSGEFPYYYPGGVMGRANITNNDIIDNGEQGIYLYRSFYAPESAHGGTYAFYSGTGNYLDRNLTNSFNLGSLSPGDSATMTFWLWYNMGGDDDDGFQVLYYNRTWARWLPLDPVGSYDTSNTIGYPYGPGTIGGLDDLQGFAEYNELTYWLEDGWMQVEYDLSQFIGNGSTTLRFRYGSDQQYYGTGCFIDDIMIFNATGYSPFSDGADPASISWTYNGWQVLNVGTFSGTETLIQNNTISENGLEGIYVGYSDVDILDNTLWDNSDQGIQFDYFVDGLIDNNVLDMNDEENIEFDDWIEATVTNNEITNSDGDEGIDMENYCRVLIDNNNIAENDGDGIYAYYFCDLIITNNDISYNGEDGMDIEGYGTYYYVENNVVTYNSAYGFYTYETYGMAEAPYAGSSFYWAQGQYAESNQYLIFDFDLKGVSSADLTFQHAYNTETWCDGGFVEFWNTSSGMWETLYPVEGYVNPYISGDGNGPNAGDYYGYDGDSMGWRTATFDLDMLTGNWTRIRFHYVADSSNTYGGWAIDNIEIAAIGFFDGAEGAPPAEQIRNHGFQKSTGRWNYILNNIFNNNNDDGLYLDETDVNVENNVITFNDGYGIYVYDYSYAYIDGNEITFNDDYGVYIEEYCYVELRNNNISYNYYGIYIYDYCQVIVDNNIIEYTYDYNDDSVLQVEDYCYVEITNNYIAYNNKDFWFYAIYLEDIENSFIIRDNKIIENGYGIYLESTYVTPPPSGTYAWHTQNTYERAPMILERSFNLGSLLPGDEATLTFWHWYDIGSDAGGCVQVFNSTSNSWETIDPIDEHDYDDSDIQRLYDSAGYGDSDNSWNYEWNVFYETYSGYYTWDGCDDGWIFAEFDLSPWAGDTDVRVRWLYAEDDSVYAGWFIDDIAVPEIGFLSDAEDLLDDNSGWTADGWTRHAPAGIIENNDIMNNLGYGIEMDEESYPDIINNRIMGNGYNGIYVNEQFGDQYGYIRPAAPSGTHMWYSGYSNYADFYLYRQFDLTTYQEVILTFYHWYYTENSYDGGVVEVYSNGQWLKAEPRGTYPDQFYYGGEGYSNEDEYEWYYAHFDLSKYAGQMITLRFRFMTDSSSLYTGWYIDDITMIGDRTVFYYDDMEEPKASYMDWNTGGSNIVDNRYGPPKGWSIMETNAMIIQRNRISYNGYEQYAGIYFDDYVNAILDDNDINHNGEEGDWGPGLYAYEDSTLSVRNNRIRHNAYGGVYADEYVYGVWQNNLITHNYGTEEEYDSGHGVYFYDYCSGIFVNNYIADNQHAGMYLEYGDYVIKGNTITNNHWQGIHIYDCGYDEWNHPVYLEDNEITDNYMFDRLDGYEEDEWSGCGLFVESSSYIHVFNGVYSNNERYGIFVTDSVEEFQWIIDHEAEAENNGMRIYGGDYYVESEFGGGEIYPVLVADGGYLTLKNVRDFQTWLLNDDEWYGIEVETGGTLDARDTTFDSWYDEYINAWDYDIPHYVWSFRLPFPGMDDNYYDYGQFDDNDLVFSGGDAPIIFATEIEWGRSWTAEGEYQVNYRTGEVRISNYTIGGTGPTSMTYDYTSKRPLPYTFRVFGNLHMDDCKVVNTTSVYLETTGSVEIYSTEFTENFHGGVTSINSYPIISDCWFHDLDFGVFAEGGVLVIGGGNLFEDNEDAVQLTEWSTSLIYGNTFMGNRRGITVYDSTDLIIMDNYIDNCADDGMHIVNSMATISGNSVSNCNDKAIYLRSTDATMDMNTLMDNHFSVYASDTDLTMTSDSISGSALEDIYSEDNSDVTALDVSFDRDEVLMVVDNSLIRIQWYTTVEVLGMNGKPLEGADVSVSSSTPSSYMTGVSGLTSKFVTTEYIQYSTYQDDRKPHTISALGNLSGIIYLGFLDVDITESGKYTIGLNFKPYVLPNPIKYRGFYEDTTFYSAFGLDYLFGDDGGYDYLTYWWSGNSKVIITANPDNMIDLSAAPNWDGIEVVEFFAMDYWGETISHNITIEVYPVNDPPKATDVTLIPTNPDNMDDLIGYYTWYDSVEGDDNETGSIITWYRSTDGGLNYHLVEEHTVIIVVPGWENDYQNIYVEYTDTNWGEKWYFTVEPGDEGGALGDEVASNIVTITRIIPEIYFDDVYILPSYPLETDYALFAYLENPDGDTSLTMYQWYRNGVPIEGATSDILWSNYWDEGDIITVEAIPYDGYNEGDPVMSSEGVVIENSPPTLESVYITPQKPHSYEDLTAIPVGYWDPDIADYAHYTANATSYYHLFYTFTWYVNNQVIRGVTGDTLDHTHFDVNDVIYVTATPWDGETNGTGVDSEEVTISTIPADEDYDQDGIPNHIDLDDDGDGVPDINDAFPFDPDESKDFDKDGIGDKADDDDDNDGFPDNWDFAPKDADVQWQPWIYLAILILVILLIIFAYFKWWHTPREKKPKVPKEKYYEPPEEETTVEEEDVYEPETVTEDEDLSPTMDEELSGIEKEPAMEEEFGGETSADEPLPGLVEDKPKKKRKKRKKFGEEE